MGQDLHLTLRAEDEGVGADALSPQGTVDQDGMADLAHKVREEVEHFINGHIDDSTQGWPVLSRRVRKRRAE
jgi:hypothetical protein